MHRDPVATVQGRLSGTNNGKGVSMSKFRVALSHDFRNPDGSPMFPGVDYTRFEDDPNIEYGWLDPADVYTADQLADFDALILLSQGITPASLDANRRLAIVARFGVGYDNVDLDAATAADVAVVITPDAVRRPVAVAILTLLLALAGRLLQLHQITQGNQWERRSKYPGIGLIGRTLGSIGIGNIGAEVFRLARPFDLSFIAHDPYVDKSLAEELGVRLVDIETVFRESDFLNVSVPLSDETRGLVNAERIALMKPTAFFINTSRGPVVDQKALTAALQARRIAGAGLDVFEKEPSDPDDPLLGLDNVILTPHRLCTTDQMRQMGWNLDVEAVLDVMHGRAPPNVINRAVLDSAAFQARLAGFRERFGG